MENQVYAWTGQVEVDRQGTVLSVVWDDEDSPVFDEPMVVQETFDDGIHRGHWRIRLVALISTRISHNRDAPTPGELCVEWLEELHGRS